VSILTVCPHCGEKYKMADDSKVGKKIRCRECEEPFVIKAAKSQAVASPVGKSPVKSAAKTGRGGTAGLPPRTLGLKSKSKKKSKEADGEAQKKPKKKSKSSAGKSPALAGGLCVLVLALLIGLPMLFSGDEPMQPPESYSEFTHQVNSEFKCEYPEGWTLESGGASGKPVWAKFSTGDVKIRVRSSMGYSAIGAIAGSMSGPPTGDEEVDEALAPVARVHELSMKQFADEYSDYQENPPLKIDTGFGDTRVSEFTASGSFGAKTRGMRASMLGKNLQFTVICDCPEEDWDVCRAIFDRVIKSMSRG
jgi:DNA-directed RNA polymerase subunit RPC12/RpoP